MFELPPAHFFHLIPFPMGAVSAAPVSSHFVSNEGSVIPTHCPRFVSIVGSVYPTHCPSILNRAVVFTLPPFPSILNGGGGIHPASISFHLEWGQWYSRHPHFLSISNRGGGMNTTAPVSFVSNGHGMSPTHRPHFFTPNDGGISFPSN